MSKNHLSLDWVKAEVEKVAAQEGLRVTGDTSNYAKGQLLLVIEMPGTKTAVKGFVLEVLCPMSKQSLEDVVINAKAKVFGEGE